MIRILFKHHYFARRPAERYFYFLTAALIAFCADNAASAQNQAPPPQQSARPVDTNDITDLKAGKAAYENRNYGEALRSFSRFRDLRPNNLSVHFWLGATLTALGQVNAGTAEYVQCLNLSASIGMDCPEMRNNLAENLIKSGFLKEPLFDYQRAIAIDPRCPPPYLGLAKCLIESGNFDDALVALNSYQKAGGQDINSLLLHGLAMAGKDKLDVATEDLNTFIASAQNGGNRGPLDQNLPTFTIKYATVGGVNPEAINLARHILDEIQQRH